MAAYGTNRPRYQVKRVVRPTNCPIRVRPGCHRPPGLVCGHRPITEREVNCVVQGTCPSGTNPRVRALRRTSEQHARSALVHTGDYTKKERDQMRKIVTAVTAAALSLSMLAAAVPALAVSGYDSAYAGESAFVNISPGQTLNFQVFFANTGTTTWSRGTGTQVDLAACLEDKVSCNAQDASEASWNSNWLSATRYATTTQTTTAPGSLGTFSYNVTAPVGATAGTYRFNGDVVLSTTGERIHPDGYYQDATVGTGGTGGAATLTG